MDIDKKFSDSKCCTPSSEPFRIYLKYLHSANSGVSNIDLYTSIYHESTLVPGFMKDTIFLELVLQAKIRQTKFNSVFHEIMEITR
jgi:hypothetical protein